MRLGISLSLTQQFGGFSPASLFFGGQQGAWYDPSDLNTLFQDAAGTTPVTAAGQPVGLVLDKSRGLVLGSEQLGSGVTGIVGTLATPATYNTSTGAGSVSRVSFPGEQSFVRFTGLTANALYRIQFSSISSASGINVRSGSESAAGVLFAPSVLTGYVQASATGVITFTAGANATVNFVLSSVRELPGNHATQATAASRPTYGIVPRTGRRNLCFSSENLATYTPLLSPILTSNAGVAPDGTTTATQIEVSAGQTGWSLRTVAPASVANVPQAVSFYFKPVGAVSGNLALFTANRSSLACSVNLATMTVSTSPIGDVTAASGVIDTLPNGWYRFRGTWTVSAPGVGETRFYLSNAAAGQKVLVWGLQYEYNTTTVTAYQRVVSAFDVTEAGVQSLSYLFFDGIDDFLVTPTITPNIDKAQVFAGVRKLSDAAIGLVAEFSANINTNNGVLALWNGGQSAGGATYTFVSKGTTYSSAGPGNNYASPITNVLTGLGDISGDLATLRVNGSQVAQSTADQGTGNYLAYPLYIGRRGGTTSALNGQIYSLIVRFGANLDAGTISQTETWVNGKTGAY